MKKFDIKVSTIYKLGLQFFKFGLVGLCNTAISLLIYYIFIFFNSSLYLLGNAIGFLVSTLNAYYFNNKYVFVGSKKRSRKKTLIKTYIIYTCSLILSTTLLYIFVDLLQINEKIAPICCLIITVPLNFLTNKFWVYAKKRDSTIKKNMIVSEDP